MLKEVHASYFLAIHTLHMIKILANKVKKQHLHYQNRHSQIILIHLNWH
jgi:hypothetical protein